MNLLFIIVCITAVAVSNLSIGIKVGKRTSTTTICKQAYTAKVHEQIPLCKEWKERIDMELNDKLGVK